MSGNDPVLVNSRLNIATNGAGQFVMRGSGGYSGNLGPAQRLIIRGIQGLSASITAANGFTNNGTIILDSTGNGFAQLEVTTGTLVNNGTISLNEGGSNQRRTLRASLTNNGNINLNTSNSRIDRGGGNYLNSGIIRLNNAAVTMSGNNLTNAASGFIAGEGSLNLGGLSSFVNDGKLSVKIVLLPLPPPPPSFPGAGTDGFLSVAVFEIEIPGVLRTLTPALFDFRTVVGRTGQLIEDDPAPETIELLCSGLPSVPPGQECVFVDFPDGFGGVGRREVTTEIQSLQLKDRVGAGFSVLAGQPALDFLTQLGAPQLFTPSLGQVEANQLEPDSPFPADSFFNIYAVVQTPFGPLFNEEPLVVVSRGIGGFPPVAFYPHESKQDVAVPFFSLADPFGPPVAFLTAAVHGTRLDELVGVPVDDPAFEQLALGTIIGFALPPTLPLPAPPPSDTVPPTTTKVATPAPNPTGWNNTDVTLTFAATDAAEPGGTPSGVASITVTVNGVSQSCPSGPSCTVVLTAEGASTVEFFATDNAGNAETTQSQVHKIDKTGPTITSAQTPAANAAGWNNTDVTVSFSCEDALSGVESCSAATTLTGEGAGQSVTGTAVDLAGNSASATVGNINIDKTAPECSCQPTTNPSGKNTPKAGDNPKSGQNPDGFYVLNASDGLSGLDGGITFSDTGSSATFGPFEDRTKIKLTQAPGTEPTIKPGAGDTDWKIRIKGDGEAMATDVAGNSTSVSCNVPLPPK